MSGLIVLAARLAHAALSVEDFESLLQEAAEEVASTADADFVSILRAQGGHRFEYRFDRHGRVPPAFAFVVPKAQTAGRRSQVVVAGSADDPGMAPVGLRCAVITPIPIGKGEALLLSVAYGEPGRIFVSEDLQGLEAVASVLALGASRSSFQELALYDPATRLYNRRWLDASLPAEVERALRYRQPLALLLLDVDSFKEINDRHGHVMGDRVLAEISRVLSESVRSCDAAARVGGDEFAVLLPATSARGADHIAHRVLERVRSLSLGDAVSPVRVTVSGGVSLVDPSSTAESLYAEADRALYAAKRAGRDTVTVPERTPVLDEGMPQVARGRRRNVAGL